MDKIVIKHSRIEINNYDIGDCPRLEYIMSVYDHVRHKSFIKGMYYNSEKKQLRVPRGIDIEFLKKMFYAEPVVDRISDPYINTAPIPIKYLPKDTRQQDILKFILGINPYEYTRTKSQLCINSATGSGKTFVTVAAMATIGARTIIITNSISWLNQWRDRIMEYTPIKDNQIYMISGSSSIDKLIARDSALKYQVFLVSHSTIRSYGEKKGWDKVEELFKYLRCYMKIYDEAHLYFDNLAMIDFHSNTKKTLYLTATPARSDHDENVIYQWYFKNVPGISLFNEDTDPHVNYLSIHFKSHPTPFDMEECKSPQYGLNRIKYIDFVTNNINFRKLLVIIIDLCLNISGKVLIYIGTNNSIENTVNYILKVFPFLENHIGIYTSYIKENKEDNLYKKFIISTTKSCGAASDIQDLTVTVNLAEPFKSQVLAQQTLGRCRIDNSLYIDIVDDSFYHCKKYYEYKKPIYSRYAKTCKSLVMSDDELDTRYNQIMDKYNKYKIMCMPVYKQD